MNYDIEKINNYLKEHLSEHRYIHSISVADTAKELAGRFNCDKDKAYIAGLLHDIAKQYNDDKLLELAKKYNIKLSKDDIDNKGIIHSYVGAYLAKEIFNIDDEIFNAIYTHSLGDYKMSKLQKIIFIADFIEPKRKFIKDIPEVVEASKEDLDKCLLLTFKRNIEYIKSKGQNIHKKTVDIYEKIKK